MSAATLDPSLTAASDPSKLTRVQKLAALLVVLGPDSAAEILRGLDQQEVTAITAAMTSLPAIDQRLQREVLREFSGVAVTASTALRGGIDFAQSTLEKALGPSQARQVIGRVAPTQAASSPMHEVVEKDARQIANALKTEQPQTISFVDHRKATEVLNLFSDDLRSQVIERLATLSPTPTAVVETLAQLLLKRIGTTSTVAFNQTGGVHPAANVLKAMNKDASRALLEAIEQRDPELSKAIRNKMFTFEDVAKLAVADLQKILREVDARALATALRTASDTVKTKMLSGLSKRAAEAIEEEMSFLGKVKAKDVEMAQLGIVELVRRLEAEGQIEIPEQGTA